ncbi:hypothetical protein EV363DRAFT_1185868 [Boletus edulis]|nr:hypothetical protein EV363DRAFT_1185868 [Boletus edulis]
MPEDPLVIPEDPPMMLNGDPLLTLDNHDDALSDFHGGSSQAPSSFGYDSETPAAYWSSRASSPVSDFAGYSSNFGDVDLTTMLDAPLLSSYLPTAVPSSSAVTPNAAYPVPYVSPAFSFLSPSPSLFDASQVVVPRTSHSNSSAYGLPHTPIFNEMAYHPPHIAPSNVMTRTEYPRAAAPNVNYLNTSNPLPSVPNQTAPDPVGFTPSNAPNRMDQLHPVTSGPQNSGTLTTAHLSQSIPAAANCGTDSISHTQQQESIPRSSDPLDVVVAHNTQNVTDNPPILPEAANDVTEKRRSGRRPVPSTRADLANSIGGNTHAVQALTTTIKKRGNTDPGNFRGAK